MNRKNTPKKTSTAFDNFMIQCEDLSTFVDIINKFFEDSYGKDVPTEKKFFTGFNFKI